MIRNIRAMLAPEIVGHIGLTHVTFSWDDEPPESGGMIKDAVIAKRDGTESPLAEFGCFIQVYDESDPTTGEEYPFEWVFELAHEFGNIFQSWRIYKRDFAKDSIPERILEYIDPRSV